MTTLRNTLAFALVALSPAVIYWGIVASVWPLVLWLLAGAALIAAEYPTPRTDRRRT